MKHFEVLGRMNDRSFCGTDSRFSYKSHISNGLTVFWDGWDGWDGIWKVNARVGLSLYYYLYIYIIIIIYILTVLKLYTITSFSLFSRPSVPTLHFLLSETLPEMKPDGFGEAQRCHSLD